MPKQIPTIGDPNWGTPLNAHLSQLQNPTTGGINSFEQFSGRPTNLTADDVGKTYLYTQTGNIHQWTGSVWKVLNESVINVKDYGAVGDGVVDDTTAVQALIDKCSPTQNKPLFFSEGTFLFNIVFDIGVNSNHYYIPDFVGNGRYSTKISSFTPTGFAFTFGINQTWTPFEIRNLAIVGNDTKTKNGIQFGHPNFLDTDQFSGGVRLVQVYMTDMDICILKRYGDIGNYFESCSFRNSNYHYKAIGYKGRILPNGVTSPGDHTGCDTFYKCEFGGAFKASIFVDGNGEGVNGQHIFRDCVFQQNTGYAIYVKNYVQAEFTPGFLISDTWFEFNAVNLATFVPSAPVDIDGVVGVPKTIYFNGVDARIENCQIYEIELINSRVIAKGVGSLTNFGVLAGLNITKDNKSSIQFEEVKSNKDFPYFTKDIIFEANRIVCTNTSVTLPRQSISHSSDNLIYSESYSQRENILFSGFTGVNAQKLVKDGTLFDRCQEIDINPTNNNANYVLDSAAFQVVLPIGKFIFWSLDVKKVSGDDITLAFSKDYKMANYLNISNTKWTTYVGLGDTLNTTGILSVEQVLFSKDKVTRFRIACFQVLAFDTLQELMDYSDSLQFRVKNEKIISHSSVLPILGEYNIGDIIYNTNPTPGGYVGWICTASGTPGTWKGFGLIEV
jgi:Pectate lyase superfamily protein